MHEILYTVNKKALNLKFIYLKKLLGLSTKALSFVFLYSFLLMLKFQINHKKKGI
jgi:hypothetical protein